MIAMLKDLLQLFVYLEILFKTECQKVLIYRIRYRAIFIMIFTNRQLFLYEFLIKLDLTTVHLIPIITVFFRLWVKCIYKHDDQNKYVQWTEQRDKPWLRVYYGVVGTKCLCEWECWNNCRCSRWTVVMVFECNR